MLRVIDTSVYQSDLVVAATNADAFIVKATGGNGYVNPDCDDTVQQTIALGKPFGFYHYFSDGFNDGDPTAEANWFVDNCLGYFNRGIPILDWERGGNPDVSNTGKAMQFLAQVEARTGVKPLIYMSLSLVTSMDWSAVVANNNGLWCADYVDNNTPITNFAMDPNRDPNPTWDGNVNDVLWQFTSTGRIDGYGGNLDCSFAYVTRAGWDAYAGVHAAPAPDPTTTTTTEAPAPDPTTTTTTVAPEPTPDPDPTTTTTTTEEPQPVPSTTTTTTTGEPDSGTPGQNWLAGFLAGIGAFFVWILNKLRGTS